MSSTIRCAIEGFADRLNSEGLGDDEHGLEMVKLYNANIAAIRALLYKNHPTRDAEKISTLRDIVADYYSALDKRENGNAAQDIAFSKIQDILGMRWQQGK